MIDEVTENTGSWVPSTEKQEDKLVTFMIPLKKGNNSISLSFDFDTV